MDDRPPDLTAWFDAIPVGLVEAHPDGRIRRVNATLLGWTGYAAADLLDQVWYDRLLSPGARVLARTHILPILAREGRLDRLILDLLARDGRRIHAVVHVARVAGTEGDPPHDRLTFIEAPERRAWEEQLIKANRAAEDALEALRELNLDLEAKVAERTEALASANKDLDAYARSVAHDLRGPLQAILALGQALEASAGPTLAAPDATRLTKLLRAAGSMETLIGGLLQLARASGSPLTRQPVDLSAIAARVCGELQAGHPGRAVALTVASGLHAWGDPALLEVVLRNLLSNAWKYTAATPEARIAFEREGDGAFVVRDNGAGFDMAVSDRLFQPFQRLHDAQAFPGIGLGLVAVKRIIERHGGHLRVLAAPGRGAAFHFTLGDPPEPGA
ncbi:sensor histidine kinase [Mesoterricola sediminis]|uniref:histidine kinase n=1 Tax=Mesoterricola sediminis TaxID=2927980 RepID=A0AA48GUQ3_9BACT|nr:ATP-binding protein [Mesoterricola sediminis]BDU78129.1 hypothetical protein METESE_30870 [Mesoterricola sediminis]